MRFNHLSQISCGTLNWHIRVQGNPGGAGVCCCKDSKDELQTILQPDGDDWCFVTPGSTSQSRYGS